MAGEDVWAKWNISACEEGREWSQPPGRADQERTRETIAAIPEDVETVLDAGCGNGWLCNRLNGRYHVVALDYVSEALQYVQVPKVRGDLRALPFPDKSFDLVLACEVLEHLDHHMYQEVLRELARIARRYVLVSVPNTQDLGLSSYRCPKCGTVFTPDGHVRSFSADTLATLFDRTGEKGYETCLWVRDIVPVTGRRQSHVLVRLNPVRFGYWRTRSNTLCPNCGFEGRADSLLTIVWRTALRAARFLYCPACSWRSAWLLACYEW